MLYQQKDTSKSIKEKDNESDGDDSDEHYSADPSEADDRERDANDAAEKEVTAKDKGKIIKDEQDEIVQVQMKSFARYFNYAGGWCLLIPYLIILVAFIIVSLAITFFTQTWAYADEETQQDEYLFYAGMIIGLSALSAVLVYFRINAQIQGGLRVGRIAHDILIAYVFRAPINLYFDVTPIGKILNRFSKDMAVIDESIYYNFGGFIVCVFQALQSLVVASIAVPYIVAVIVVFSVFVYWLFSYSMRAYKDCYRIETVTMSPILSYFQETFNGNSIVRAYGKE